MAQVPQGRIIARYCVISSPGTDNNTDLGIRSLSGLRLQFDFGLPGILCSIIPNHFLRATLQLCVNSQGP